MVGRAGEVTGERRRLAGVLLVVLVWLAGPGMVEALDWGKAIESAAFHGGLTAGDLWSTERALRNPEVYETNPWAYDLRTRVPIELAISWADYEVGKRYGWKVQWGLRALRGVIMVRVIRQNLRNSSNNP